MLWVGGGVAAQIFHVFVYERYEIVRIKSGVGAVAWRGHVGVIG